MDNLMKEILEYALERMKNDLEHEQTINELFTKKDNHEYRKGFYEVTMAIRKTKKKGVISFKEFCERFNKTSEETMAKLLVMIQRIEKETKE